MWYKNSSYQTQLGSACGACRQLDAHMVLAPLFSLWVIWNTLLMFLFLKSSFLAAPGMRRHRRQERGDGKWEQKQVPMWSGADLFMKRSGCGLQHEKVSLGQKVFIQQKGGLMSATFVSLNLWLRSPTACIIFFLEAEALLSEFPSLLSRLSSFSLPLVAVPWA